MSVKSLIEALESNERKNVREGTIPVLSLDALPEGAHKIRFLPNLDDPESAPFRRVRLHQGYKHPDYQNNTKVSCLGRECVMCADANNKGDRSLWARVSHIGYALLNDEGLVMLRMSEGSHPKDGRSGYITPHLVVMDEILDFMKTKGSNVFSLNEGHNVELVRSGMGKDSKYFATVSDQPSSITDEAVLDSWKKAKALTDFYKPMSPEDMKRVIEGKSLKREEDGGLSLRNELEGTQAKAPEPQPAKVVQLADAAKASQLEALKKLMNS